MITKKQAQIIINTLMPFNPNIIGVFGSYARGENTKHSDIDILYNFNNCFSLFDIIEAKQELERQLNNSVDLVDYKAIHPLLRDNIIKDLKLIYEK